MACFWLDDDDDDEDDECEPEIYDYQGLRRHFMKQHNTAERKNIRSNFFPYYKCSQCGQCYPSWEHLHYHVKRSDKLSPCLNNGFTWTKPMKDEVDINKLRYPQFCPGKVSYTVSYTVLYTVS